MAARAEAVGQGGTADSGAMLAFAATMSEEEMKCVLLPAVCSNVSLDLLLRTSRAVMYLLCRGVMYLLIWCALSAFLGKVSPSAPFACNRACQKL